MTATAGDVQTPVDLVVVDDAAGVRAVVVGFLRLDGRFRVVGEGATGADAVALAARHRPSVMVLDASMPDTDGLAALPAILERSPATRVAIFSGFSGPALAARARELGAEGVIDKATPVRVLARRLLEIAGRDAADGTDTAPHDDATEAEAETVLSRHLERFRTVFDQGAIGMATMTFAGTIVRANPALCRMLGTAEEELVTRSFTSLAAERTAPALHAAVVDVTSGTHEVVAVEHRLRSHGERWLRSTVAAVLDAVGTPLYLFAQAEEITDHHVVLEEVRQSEERFRLLVEGVRDYAIFMLDPAGHVTTWNAGAQRMKGYRADEIVGQHFRIFYEGPARSVRHPEHELLLAVANGRYEEEGWRVRKDGTRFWANVVITALFDHNGDLAGFAKVTRDITERRLAEEAQDAFTAELESANKALTSAARQTAEFVAMTAHELRSPIAAVTGAATILRDYWDVLDAGQRADTLDCVLRGGNRLRRLIEDLLTVSRLEAGSFHYDLEVVELRTVVDEVLGDHVNVVGPVSVECPPGLAVKSDRVRCVQILTNLVANAGLHGSSPIRVTAASQGSVAEVRVYDEGGGPSVSMADRLFEKFARGCERDELDGRAEHVEPGTGLGLFIVRELARGQGGDAWHEREADGAQCFAFSLPLA